MSSLKSRSDLQPVHSDTRNNSLRITEIFYSLQGETKTMGWPTAFVRLTGCPLRCQYCDSAYAFRGGRVWTIAQVLQKVARYQPRYVTVTGGEPLAQPACLPLLTALCDLNYQVSLETSGALDVKKIDTRVVKVLDIKTPASQEVAKNCFDNLDYLTSEDQVKFVICDRADYDWAKQVLRQYRLTERCEVLFSPSFQQLENHLLADWLVQDNLAVRMQLQMHKYIWGDVPGK